MTTKPTPAKEIKPAPKPNPSTKEKPSPKSPAPVATNKETTDTPTEKVKSEPIQPSAIKHSELKTVFDLNKPPAPAPTLEALNEDLKAIRKLITDHTLQINQIQEVLARKRKPVASTDKVQIKDKQTGTIYPSKNGAYQSLLKSGSLKEMVDKGVFGPNPEKNTFGWYALVREQPDRFEEVHTAQEKAKTI